MLKKWIFLLAFLLVLPGCGKEDAGVEPMLQLRSSLLNAGCTFEMEVTADFGDKTYGFSLDCAGDEQGNITFRVKEPQTIAGITGRITGGKGELTFDGTALAFELLGDGALSPVSAPWVLVSTLRSGRVSSGGRDGELYQISLRSSYREDALQVEVWLDENNTPVRGEIFREGRRILTMEIEDFVIV